MEVISQLRASHTACSSVPNQEDVGTNLPVTSSKPQPQNPLQLLPTRSRGCRQGAPAEPTLPSLLTAGDRANLMG